MTDDLVLLALQRFNEAISAATVIFAASMLLYNLTHGRHDRVLRASNVLLGCVTMTYLGDLFLMVAKTPHSMEVWLRFQWIGIAFVPAAVFHLSDALLATTGLISRGRRRRVTRILYLYGVVFLLTAAGSDLIVHGLTLTPMPMMYAGSLFWLYLVYFVAATAFAVNNVLRARRRCLTTATHRRMTYLLLVFLTPSAGIFPYSLLFSRASQADSFWLWLLVNVGNLGIVVMLAFMAYPLSFFGSNKPDRVIKAELLRFMLRGPVTGVVVMLVILFVPATRLLGLPGAELMPFAAVGTVLFLEWAFTVGIPKLERILLTLNNCWKRRWLPLAITCGFRAPSSPRLGRMVYTWNRSSDRCNRRKPGCRRPNSWRSHPAMAIRQRTCRFTVRSWSGNPSGWFRCAAPALTAIRAT
jgi:hypothetical protein